PFHASWLNQAEILLNIFSNKYIKRGSWNDKDKFINHLYTSLDKYNNRSAHPFEWSFTRHAMRNWYSCKICPP
ncbi:MAG: IS630 family transposase, partial [bacterium]